MARGTGLEWKALRTNRTLHWALGALAALAVLFVAISWPRWQLRAQVATGFGARVACSCRYIEGRGLDSCKSDFAGLKGMGLVRFTDDPAQRTVHASVPLLASRKAAFKPGYGCLPDKVN